ncbi:response regulator transcription factor [Thiomicrorhabdus indica]|uniref:response regulator transcription factor n=1 Tax=Thiomicrorhabdus indica TaxID=2267253 RepID=UPI00102DB485|nr:response regulator transcription factor [Thiomicrorhabdus indica]
MLTQEKLQSILLLSHQRTRFASWLTAIPDLKLQHLDCDASVETFQCPSRSVVFIHWHVNHPIESWITLCQDQQSDVVIVSDHPSPDEGLRFFKLGVKGYIASDTHPKNVCQVIDVVQQGNVWLGHSVMSAFIENVQQEKQGSDEWKQGLTAREIETAEAILQGKTNKEIAELFFVTERTVKSHVHNLLEKLQVKDRLALVLKIQSIRHPE